MLNWDWQGHTGHWKGGDVLAGIARFEILPTGTRSYRAIDKMSGKEETFLTVMGAKVWCESRL